MKRTPWIMMLLCAGLVACTQRAQPDSSATQQEADSRAVPTVAVDRAVESEASDSEQKPADSNEAVARLFGAALLCQSDPPDGREPETRQRLESLGVTVTHYDPENDGLLDLHYQFAAPVTIEGQEVSAVSYVGDSGSLFYASVQGDMAALVERLGAAPNADNSPAFGYAINAEYFKEVDPGSEDTDRMGVVIGRDQKQEGTFNFGCRRFDN